MVPVVEFFSRGPTFPPSGPPSRTEGKGTDSGPDRDYESSWRVGGTGDDGKGRSDAEVYWLYRCRLTRLPNSRVGPNSCSDPPLLETDPSGGSLGWGGSSGGIDTPSFGPDSGLQSEVQYDEEGRKDRTPFPILRGQTF